MKEDLKKKLILVIAVVAEIVLMVSVAVSIKNTADVNESFMSETLTVSDEDTVRRVSSPEFLVTGRGIYGVSIYLEPHESPMTVHTYSSKEDMLKMGDIKTDGPDTQIDYEIYAAAPAYSSVELVFDDKEYTENEPVRRIDVYSEKGHTLAVFLFSAVILFALGDILIFMLMFRREYVRRFIEKNGVFLTVLVFTVLICSIPIMCRGILEGDDKEFHLMRIQGLADGLRSGYFPVKIQPGWYNDFTYPVGVYYGQILLYPSAILRMIGFPLSFTYKVWLYIINILTFGVTYFVCRKITDDENMSLALTVFYMLSLYRLVNMYKRCAIGEAQAMIFLPLFILGFAALYDRLNTKDDNAWIYLTVATTGIINSHTITTFLAIFMTVIFVLLNLKKTFTKDTMIQYGRFLGMTVLLNLFYLVPFFDYLVHYSKKVDSEAGKKMAAKAAYLPQIFSQAYSVTGHNGNFTANGDMPLSIGVSALLILTAFIILYVKHKVLKNKKTMIDMLILFLISVVMSTSIFPYNQLEYHYEKIYGILQKIQYPWRFLGFASVFIFFIFIITVMLIGDSYGKKVMWLYVSAILLVTCWQSSEMMNRIVNENPAFDIYSIINPYWTGGEYLPSNTDVEQLGYTDVLTSDPSVIVSNMVRDGVDITVDVVNGTQDVGYVQLPLLCYPYYRTVDGEGHELETIPGDYRKLCFGVPAGFNGKVHTYFREPVWWRLSEIISLVTLLFMVRYFKKGRQGSVR